MSIQESCRLDNIVAKLQSNQNGFATMRIWIDASLVDEALMREAPISMEECKKDAMRLINHFVGYKSEVKEGKQ